MSPSRLLLRNVLPIFHARREGFREIKLSIRVIGFIRDGTRLVLDVKTLAFLTPDYMFYLLELGLANRKVQSTVIVT